MNRTFDYFVIFAEMRTGSNFLEANLNRFEDAHCFGEAFNPAFTGQHNHRDLLGLTIEERDKDPAALLERVKTAGDTMNGFRFFHNHDPRIVNTMLEDPRCAKIILTRNPAQSYVSWKIAQQTNQWRLTDVNRRKESLAEFEPAEFAAYLEALQSFQTRILRALQISGQTAFYLAYEDLSAVQVMNGLAQWLGLEDRLEALDEKMKPQNPAPIQSKVSNYSEMEAALSDFDRFDLTRTPNFEPRRGPAVPGYVAAAQAPIMYLPIRNGLESHITDWLASLDQAGEEALQTQFSQKTLRAWMRDHPGHKRFTVLRHPLARAHQVFCTKILPQGPGTFGQIRRKLINRFNMPLPKNDQDAAEYDVQTHRVAFEGFLSFLKQNLAGQTNIRMDDHWRSQLNTLQGFAGLAMPDVVLREEQLSSDLPALMQTLGYDQAPAPISLSPDTPYALADIYDETLEHRARAAYGQDYLHFGFGDWQP